MLIAIGGWKRRTFGHDVVPMNASNLNSGRNVDVTTTVESSLAENNKNEYIKQHHSTSVNAVLICIVISMQAKVTMSRQCFTGASTVSSMLATSILI